MNTRIKADTVFEMTQLKPPINETTDSSKTPDAKLLQRFFDRQEEAAFATLVERYAPLVMGISKRVLRDTQEAEDAFQAVFLTLSQKGQTIRNTESIAAWLFRVAHREAVKRAKLIKKNRSIPLPEEPMDSKTVAEKADQTEIAIALQEEISQLPETYRGPIVLCYLQEKTREMAAQELARTDSSIKASLARGRDMLKKRLLKRGIAYSAAFAAWQSTQVASAATITTSLVAQTTALSVSQTVSVPSSLMLSKTFTSGALKIMAISTTGKTIIGFGVISVLLLTSVSILALKEAPSQRPRVHHSEQHSSSSTKQPAKKKPFAYPAEYDDLEQYHACIVKFIYALQNDKIDKAIKLINLNPKSPKRSLEEHEQQRRLDLAELTTSMGETPLKLIKLYVADKEVFGVSEIRTFIMPNGRSATGSLVFTCAKFDNWLIDDIDLEFEDGSTNEIERFINRNPNVQSIDLLTETANSQDDATK